MRDKGCPSKRISPRVNPYRPTSMRATVEFPQPDSPTSASVSPRAISNDTPSTARSITLGLPASLRSNHGGDTSNQRAASFTSTKGALMLPPLIVCHRTTPPRRGRQTRQAGVSWGHCRCHAANRPRATCPQAATRGARSRSAAGAARNAD
ncbi:hypothetical protein G6F31_017945 [Rhizopus arrhizus]|nr:hypothetical protein G6F31_017945 [Rhizopus arrhizus]